MREEDVGVALPHRSALGRLVEVRCLATAREATAPVVDVGPWNGTAQDAGDPYWNVAGRRPQAESGRDLTGRKTNGAGIDLSPALLALLGVPKAKVWKGPDLVWSGEVEWRFA